MNVPQVLVAAVAMIVGFSGFADEAVFSSDGSHIYRIPLEQKPALDEIDLVGKTVSAIPLDKFLGQESLVALARSSAGFILCATGREIWAWDPAKKSCVKVCSAPAAEEIVAVTYDPKTMATCFSARPKNAAEERADWTFYILKPGARRPLKVVLRRLDSVLRPVFDAQGNLFFQNHGDLWKGTLNLEDDPGRPDLVAERCAPLATLESQNTTPLQIGVCGIAVAGEKLYVHMKRMGGTGWGTIIRMQKPSSADDDEEKAAKNQDKEPLGTSILKTTLKSYVAALSSVETLAETGLAANLCAAPDGATVYFKLDDPEKSDWLIMGDGQPEKLHLARKAAR